MNFLKHNLCSCGMGNGGRRSESPPGASEKLGSHYLYCWRPEATDLGETRWLRSSTYVHLTEKVIMEVLHLNCT